MDEFEFQSGLSPESRRILNQNVLKLIPWGLPGATAATTANYGTMFVADRGYTLVDVYEVHSAVGNAGSTLQIEKCSSGVAQDSGTNLLQTAFDLTSTINTPVRGKLTTTRTNLKIKRGDRLVAKDLSVAGTPAGVFVQLILLEI